MQTLLQKKEDLMALLRAKKDTQERFAYVVDLGRRRAPFPPECRVETHRVEGCLSRLWLVCDFREDRCFFQADADSQIVKGIAGLLCDLYSGHPPQEIVSIDPSFLSDVGITQHLSVNRRNALTQVWERIREFARTHSARRLS
jgi:cysteine desulfuration protein SufE